MTITTYAEVELELDEIEADLINHHSQEDILNFILEIDERICDYDFTVKLRDRLNEVIAAEDAAGKSKP